MLSLHTSPLARAGLGDAGGMNVYLREVSTALAAAGSEVTIVTAGRGQDTQITPGVWVRHLGRPTGEKNHIALEIPALIQQLTPWGCHGYDIIASHYWISGLAGLTLARLWGVPLVHTMHTMGAMKNAHLAPGQNPEPARRIDVEQQLSDGADWLITNSQSEAQALQQHYRRRHNVANIPPGVDRAVFRPATAPTPATANRFRLLFAGRLQPLKGPDLAIGALAQMPSDVPAELTVIGSPSGGEAYDLLGLVARLGVSDKVTFLPAQTPPVLASHYRQADVVLMPSTSESFGMVALEAQACGTPVVASAVGGLSDAVQEGSSGWLIDSRDPAAWAALLEQAYRAGPTEWQARGQFGALRARRFTWAATAAKLNTVYTAASTAGAPIWDHCVCVG